MGEVYLALDTKLERKVAIKFLPLQSIANEQANKRLLREAKAAATLDHPNICAVHEIAEENECTFIVMQYVEGQTFDVRLKGKPLDLSESLSIATQVADALAEAHAHGIIHRDIKPQNIMITPRGQAKVMDFGLAKVVASAVESEAETMSVLTVPGVILGTIPYMSPEQVKGEQVDARTDIFSFGVVLYEAISGQQPFAGASAAATASAILTHEPAPLARFAPDIPAEVQRIVRKCLEKNRERRYQTIREVALDLDSCRREVEGLRQSDSQRGLQAKGEAGTTRVSDISGHKRFLPRRVLFASAVLLLIIISGAVDYVLIWRKTKTPALQPTIKSVVVLPLENLSGDSAQEYFADGMTEALISNLAQIRALRVISRTSAMRYKGTNRLLPEIARELNVDAVIEGSVQRSGGRVHVTARLIPAAADSPLWSRDYDRDLSDVLKLQNEVARAVADEIRIQLTADERARLAVSRKVDPQAHEAYLLGRYHLRNLNENDLSLAIEHFERAIQLAPDYAAAYAGLSDAWRERGIWGAKSFKEVESPARNAALKAMELDTQLAEGHIALGMIKFLYDWNWTGAEDEQRRALELDPGNPDAHMLYAIFLMSLGRHDEAIREMQSAEQLDPLSSNTQSNFGRVLYRARKYEEAIPHLKRALDLEPRNYSAYVRLGDVYAKLGRYDEALTMFEKAAQLRDDGTHAARIARVYALTGRQREARQTLSGLKAGAFEIAAVYVALGDVDEAFKILEKAVEERNSLLVFFKEDPSFDNLHSDPRWKELLRRMNFPSE